MENGHWYAFPYPPLFYVLCWPLVTLARMRPEVAASVLAAAVNSLEAFVVFGIARRLRAGEWTAAAAAAALAVLPLFLARLTLAYFPAMVGHAVDAIVILFLLARMRELDRPRVVFTLAGLIALALLTYTQSLLNFAVLLPLFLVVLLSVDRSPETRRRALGLVVAGALGAVLSLVVFYGRYVPTFLDMQRGVPMPEERILLEKPSTPVPEEELASTGAGRSLRRADVQSLARHAQGGVAPVRLLWRVRAGGDRGARAGLARGRRCPTPRSSSRGPSRISR